MEAKVAAGQRESRRNYDAVLKQDILECIFRHLDDAQLARAALVCTSWQRTINAMPKRWCSIAIDAASVRSWPSAAHIDVTRKSGATLQAMDVIERLKRARRYMTSVLACPWRTSACTSLSVDMRSFLIPSMPRFKAAQQAPEALASTASDLPDAAPAPVLLHTMVLEALSTASAVPAESAWTVRGLAQASCSRAAPGLDGPSACARPGEDDQSSLGSSTTCAPSTSSSCCASASDVPDSTPSGPANGPANERAVAEDEEQAALRLSDSAASPSCRPMPPDDGRGSSELLHAVMCDAADSCDVSHRAIAAECDATVQISAAMLADISLRFRNLTHLHLTTHRMQSALGPADRTGFACLARPGAFPRLQTLSIRESTSDNLWIDYPSLARLIGNCRGTLTRLDLIPRSDFPAEFIARITQHAPPLRALTLQSGQLSDASLAALARAFGPTLVTLDLTFTSQTAGWSWSGFASLCSLCSHLTSLSLCGCNLGSRELAPAIGAFTELQYLDLSWAQRRLDGDTIYAVVESLPNLRQVKMYKETQAAMLRRADLQRLAGRLFQFHPHVAVQPLTDHHITPPAAVPWLEQA